MPYFFLVSAISEGVHFSTVSTPLSITFIFLSEIPPSVRLSFAASATAIISSEKNSFTSLLTVFPGCLLIFLLTGKTECLVYIIFL